MHEFAGHVADQYSRVVFGKTLYSVIQAIHADQRALLVTSVANALNDSKKVESRKGLVGRKLLQDAVEEAWLCQAQCHGRA